MRITRAFLLAVLFALVCHNPASAARRTTCYTTWDNYYLYAAFEVQDPDIQSTNFDHMSKPWEDDAIEVFLDTDASPSPNRTPKTFQMSVSAGGGSSWLVGENGQAVPKKLYTFKYANKIQGTLNKPGDKDLGYIIELAMPWQEMGGAPKPGTVLGFNVVCRLKGETTGFASLSPNVKSEDDIQSPAKWGKIKFVDTPTIIATDNGAIVCSKVINRFPTIDGNLSPSEWSRDLSFNIALPEVAAAVETQQKLTMEKLALATYSLNNKVIPGSESTTWNASESVSWNKAQLDRMARTGIDVALPVYSANSEHSTKAINAVVQAMKDLKAEGKTSPTLGLMLDVSSISDRLSAAKPGSEEAKSVFFGAIKEYFDRIPEEFRASIQLPAEKGGKQAYFVRLSIASDPAIIGRSLIDYANEQSAKEFSGHKLLWIGDLGYLWKSTKLDAYTGDPLARKTETYDDNGWIKVARISPVTAAHGSRDNGIDGYKHDWADIVAQPTDWVIIDSWNDTENATEICPSLEFGELYSDATQLEILQFNGMHQYDAKFFRHDTPAVMLPDTLYQITLGLKNSGLKPWYSEDGVFLAGRWYKDDSLYGDSGARLPIQEKGLAGRIFTKTIGIRTVDHDGTPLPAGDYELRFELMHGRDEWFSDNGDLPLRVPVKIGTPEKGFTLVSTTVPTFMKAGTKYDIQVKLRNDGPEAWKSGTAQLAYKCSALAPQTSVAISGNVEPGRIADVHIPMICNADTQGEILWMLSVDGQTVNPSSSATASDPVAEITSNYGLELVSIDLPREVNAGKNYTITATLRNTGTDTWLKNQVSVKYLLGKQGAANDLIAKTLVPHDVKPGQQISLKTQVKAPESSGDFAITGVIEHTSGAVDLLPMNMMKVVKGR